MSTNITRPNVSKILKRWPTLNAEGIGFCHPYNQHDAYTDDERARRLAEMRIDLLNDLEVIDAVCGWLPLLVPTKGAGVGSYALKETAENALRCYVSNGAAIVAAIHCGLTVRHRGGCNVDIGIRESSLRPWSTPLALGEMGPKPSPVELVAVPLRPSSPVVVPALTSAASIASPASEFCFTCCGAFRSN